MYVTGNDDKAKLFSKMVGIDIPHIKIDVDEIQSLNLTEVVEHKAKQAYEKVGKPVIVEDTKLVINSLGLLPGPFIKFFISELTNDGICKLLDGYKDRSAVAGAAIAYYDGKTIEIFEKELQGSIAKEASGDMGFGWDSIFIPHNSSVVRGEMDEDTYLKSYRNTKPFEELAKFLKSIDKQ